eukprot:contig_23092_g5704
MSSTTFFPFVRLRIIELWHDTVHDRGWRHQRRGVSKRLQVAAVSAHLVQTNQWVKRLRVDGKVIDKAAVSRLITKAVTLYNATNSIKAHAMGRSAFYVDKLVKKRITEQGKSWRMSFEDIDKILRLVIDTQPWVGGVQRSSPPFGGVPPNDRPAAASGNYREHRRGMAGEAGSAAGGSTAGSGGGSEEGQEEADEGAGGSAIGSPGPPDPAAGTVGGGKDADGDLSEDHGGSDADSARRAADNARRLDEKQKIKRLAAVESERTKRVAVLTAAVEK